MEGCSKTCAGGVSGLPDDPLVEILSRLPAKSVCRFKCVSKAWRDLIAHPDHRKKLRQAMQGLFVQKDEFSNDTLGRISFSFVDLAAGSVPVDIDPGFSFLTELTGIKNLCFLDSCSGLILFGHFEHSSNHLAGYVVCNPTTKHWLAVSRCGSPQPLTHAYLAFDPDVSSHFHLVQFQMPEVHEDVVSLHVYSSETSTWSQNQLDEETEQGQLEGWHHQFTLDPCDDYCTFVNGFLHTVVWVSDVEQILAIDVQRKAKRMIALPGMADGTSEEGHVCCLGQSQGHLHVVSSDKLCDKLSIWVLQDYDTQEWVLKNTVNALDILGETGSMPEFEVVGIHQDCNVIFVLHQFFLHQSSSCKLIAYDMDRKEVSVISTFEDNKFRSYFARYIPYFKESPALTSQH